MSRVARLVRRGRRRAEQIFLDECEIRAPSAAVGPVDPETGNRDEVPGALRYLGACKIQTYEPFESVPQSGEHEWTVQRYFLHIPSHVSGVEVGDIVTILAAALSDDLPGRRYRVAGLHNKTATTARRLLIDEITR